MGYSLNTVIYLLFDLCSMSVILLKSMKVMSGSESSMRKEMEQDYAGTWGDCEDDGKHCRTGQSQELNCLAYAAGSHGEHTAKAFYCEVTPGLLRGSFHSSWPLQDTVPSTEVTRVTEDLKESLVHLMVMLYHPRSHVRLTAGK